MSPNLSRGYLVLVDTGGVLWSLKYPCMYSLSHPPGDSHLKLVIEPSDYMLTHLPFNEGMSALTVDCCLKDEATGGIIHTFGTVNLEAKDKYLVSGFNNQPERRARTSRRKLRGDP